MISLLSGPPSEIEQFKSAPWPHQATFQTPLQDLERFAASILGLFAAESATFSPDSIVFEPTNLLELAANASITIENQWQFILRAEGRDDIAKLLRASLGDWVDFVFVPCPEFFAIYADHDEYTTFYTHDPANLSSLVGLLEGVGFKLVPDYVRGGANWGWR